MYHNIDIEEGFNTVSKSNFIRQIQFLKDNKFDFVQIETYVELIKENNLLKNNVTITFDDAYESYLNIVLPILEEHNIPSTVFVPVNFINKFNEWDRAITTPIFKILDPEKLNFLANNTLVTIGSHGMSHSSLGTLSKEKIIFEISESKKKLEQMLNVPIRYFSFPYGQKKDINAIAIGTLKDNGYLAACSTNWNRFNSPNDLFCLNRIEIEPNDDPGSFERKVRSKYHPKFFKQVIKNLLS